MTFSVVLTHAAEKDLQETVDYVANVLDNPGAAGGLVDSFAARIERLSKYPEAHPLAIDTYLRERGVRVSTVGNYVMLYRVRKDERRVVILRFLHGRRDWMSLLGEETPGDTSH